jgi:hypothetical protein
MVDQEHVNPFSTEIPKVTEVNLQPEAPQEESSDEIVDNEAAAPQEIDPETADTEESAEPKEDKLTSARFAALSKREKEIVRKEQEFKKSIEHAKYIEENMERFKRSPKTVLSELGLDYESFTKMYLDELDGKEPERKVEDFIKEIDEKHESRWKNLEEQQKELQEQKQQEVIDNFKKQIKENLSSEESLDKYELINVKKAYDVVYGVIEQHFNDTMGEDGQGEILSIDEAADIVEKHFEEEAQTFLKAKKLQSKVAPKEKKVTTLSNKSTSTNTSVKPEEYSYLSKTEESKRRAAEKLKWI